MADLLQQGAAWLEGMRHKHASRPVMYQRADESVALNATVGRSMFQVVAADGMVEQVERRDYLVRAADLVLGGAVTMPQVGDRIRETVGDKVQVYEVMGAGQEKHFRPSDPDGLTLRIHTAHVGTE
ncbi:MAG: hypothetical protein NT049_08740 [Planctomycetota bacterium]|nr:hypothetical protein [Planctomycetota bacterium]